MKTRNAVLVLSAALLAACGGGPDLVAPEAGPRLDGSAIIGSGEKAGATSTPTLPTDTMVMASGIGTMGSGN